VGASGVELSGDIAIVTSGAGLAMASLDLLVALGGIARAVVDLGGVVFQEPEKIAHLLHAIYGLKPKAIVFNFFTQLVRCDLLATGIVGGIRPNSVPLVARIRGVEATRGRTILEGHGVSVYEDMEEAFRAVIITGSATA
jgi:succinyl-CoA synthetase beta subunit